MEPQLQFGTKNNEGGMEESGKKKWLVKDRDSRVRGPFYTDDILNRIGRGEFSGEEMISLYPSTEWIPISNDPQFYDKLLEFLDEERSRIPEEINAGVEIEDDRIESMADDFVQGPPPPPSQKDQINKREKISEGPPPSGDGSSFSKEAADSKKSEDQVIELKSIKKVLRKTKFKKMSLPAAVAFLAVVMVLAYYILDDATEDDRIHLLSPRVGQPRLSQEQVKAKVQRAVTHYVKDGFSHYLEAQSELVQVLEGDPQNAGAIALTCLTYLELWPYAKQDSSDLQAIAMTMQLASKMDPAGIEAATCRTVDLFVRGRYMEAKGATEMILDTFGRAGKPPIAFYYFKAKLFYAAKDFESASNYAKSAGELWPGWLRVLTLEAAALDKVGRHGEAANLYRKILKLNPDHKEARIGLGIIEYKFLRNYDVGERLLEVAINQKEKVTREVLAEGYLGLAEIALQKADRPMALLYAQKAYSTNSLNPRAKEIILAVGGEKKLKDTQRLDAQLVYEGDQLVREGDCNAAQAHYRAAFEINKKNALAAMKAAECLWSLSLSSEAIKWLDKAIRADTQLIDAYVLLADYYTQRYNYLAAGQILAKARTQAPKNYKVYKGFALVELRRNEANGAIGYAQKAIQLYEADVESYVILARAYILMNNNTKAFESASKAIEMDMNSRQAQVAYAEALAVTRGAHVGIDYLTRIASTYPTITEYRLALGQLYLKDQSYSSAEQVFQQVIRLEEKPKQALIGLGRALQMQKRYEEAHAAYFKAAALDPSDVEPLYLAGQLYLEAKQPTEARQQFQRVLRVNKDYPLVHYFLGRAALQLGSASEAIDQANLEKAKNPNLADPYLLAAEAYTELKQYSACAGEYQQAVNLRQGALGSDIYVRLARCYRMSGNIDAALSMINQASELESGNPEVYKEHGAIYEVRQEGVKAIEAYNQYLVLAPNAADRELIEQRINMLKGSP